MELVIGVLILVGIGILALSQYKKNKAKEINVVPYKIESTSVEVVEVPKSLNVLVTDRLNLSGKPGKMAKPKLTTVVGGPDKNRKVKPKPKAPVKQSRPKGSPETPVKKSTKPKVPKKPQA